jgi:hypothetical protein
MPEARGGALLPIFDHLADRRLDLLYQCRRRHLRNARHGYPCLQHPLADGGGSHVQSPRSSAAPAVFDVVFTIAPLTSQHRFRKIFVRTGMSISFAVFPISSEATCRFRDE